MSPQERRRPWGFAVVGAVVALATAWIAAGVYVRVGSRVEVVAVARPVEQFAEISRADLRVVRVAADPGVEVVAGERVEELVGRRAAVRLVPGALLAADHLVPADELLVGDGEAAVGLVLPAGAVPAGLVEGARVRVVVRPPAGEEGETGRVDGRVLEVRDEERVGGDRSVTVVVDAGEAEEVAAAGAEDRVALIVLGG